MNITELDQSARTGRCGRALAHRDVHASRLRTLLLLGAASAALLSGTTDAATAGTFNWIPVSNTKTSWTDASNWGPAPVGGAGPGAEDVVTISVGAPSISTSQHAVGTLDLSGAAKPNVLANAVFTVDVLKVGGASSMNIDTGAQVVVTTSLIITGGKLKGKGTIDASSAIITQSDGIMGTDYVKASTYVFSGGGMNASQISFSKTFSLSGTADTGLGVLHGGPGATMIQTGGTLSGAVDGVASYTQSGGTVAGTGRIGFSDLYALSGTGSVLAGAVLTGGTGATMTQSGGTMAGTVTAAEYTHSGGHLSGAVSVSTYELAGASATSAGATITASDAFALGPATGRAVVDAKLSGAGSLVKSGASTVVLTNAGNDFTGSVAIDAGTLEVKDGALPDSAAVTIATDATLLLATGSDTTFLGTMTGPTGSLVKEGTGTFTLAGQVALGELTVNGGKLAIGTGTSTNTASFTSALIGSGAILYVAHGATLTITVPNHIVNNGHLINDGTVHDDLDNHDAFDNNHAYNAHVATNTGTINNNTPGVWTGNVQSNTGTINNNAGATWRGNVETNAGHIGNSGTWEGDVVSNVGGIGNHGSWTGNIYMNTFGSIYNDGNTAVWTGSVINNTQVVNINGGTWYGNILGNNNVVFNMSGSTWHGDVVASGGGENSLAQIDNYGDWQGDVITNASWIFNLAGSWTGDVAANTNGIFNNAYDVNVNPTGANHAVWTGDVRTNHGEIANDPGGFWNGSVLGNSATVVNDGTWAGSVAGNAGTIRNRAVWNGNVLGNGGTIRNESSGTWTGDVASNAGTITSTGVWTGSFANAGTVNARNRINGAFDNTGLLHLTGSLSGITALTNAGTIDMLGGGAAQTLAVGTASFATGSFYDVEVDAAGNSDRIAVAGAAALGGTVRVAASPGGPYGNATPYTILTGNIAGSFAGVTTDLAFLAPRLSYDASDVYLTLMRNDLGFADAGATNNQRAAAAAVESLGAGNPVYDAVLWLTGEQAGQAFDALSGEAYSSFDGDSLQRAVAIANRATGRIDQAFDAVEQGDAVVNSYAAGSALVASPQKDAGLWAQFYGARGSVAADGNTAGLDSSTAGFAGGLDGLLGDWRLGLMLEAGSTSAAAPALGTSTTSTDYGVGVYAGSEWLGTRLSLGAAYTRHDIHSARNVVFPGFTDALAASYAAGTAQAFAQLSHEFDLGAVSLTPYAGLDYVSHATDAFVETGGAAALSRAAGVVDATFTTLGLGIDRKFLVGDDMLLTAKGSLGWRHAFAAPPASTAALVGGTSFSIVGAPLASDLVVLSAGLDLDIGAGTMLGLGYDGQLGMAAQTQALTGTWSTRF